MLRYWALLLLILALPQPAIAADGVGQVRTVAGTVSLTRAGTAYQARVGDAVLAGDLVETGADGSIGITFEDDTRISLGPGSRVDLGRFEFAPAEQRYAFVLRMTYGTLHYISGLIAKLAPAAVSVETPVGTVAVRGTRFLVRVAAP